MWTLARLDCGKTERKEGRLKKKRRPTTTTLSGPHLSGPHLSGGGAACRSAEDVRHVMTGKVDREGLKKRKEGKREERHLGDMLTPGGMRSAERRRT